MTQNNVMKLEKMIVVSKVALTLSLKQRDLGIRYVQMVPIVTSTVIV